MSSRANRLLLTSALIAPWLVLGAARADTIDVDRRDQDNVTFEGASDSQIEVLIRQFGSEIPPEDQLPDDGIAPELHRLADEVTGLYDNKQYRDFLAVLSENPELKEARPELQGLEAWSLYHTGSAKRAMVLFQELYKSEPTPGHAAGVIYSGMRTAYYTKTWEFARAHGGPLAQILRPEVSAPQAAPENALERTRSDFLNGWLRAAVRYHKYDTADNVAALIGLDTIDDVKAETLIAAGWEAHGAGRFETATSRFEDALKLDILPAQASEAIFGQALSLRDAGQLTEAAMALGRLAEPDEKARTLAIEIALALGAAAYAEKNYVSSLELSLAAKSADNEPRQAWMLEGWSYLGLNRNEEAAGVFVPAYRKLPDQESADGATASLMALGRRDELAALASKVKGPLVVPPLEKAGDTDDSGPWVMSDAESAFYRGDFTMAVPFKSELGETLAPWLGVTASYKYRDGDEGLGQLSLIGSKASYRFVTDTRVHVEANVEMLHMDAGDPPDNPLLSSSRAPGDLRPFAPTFDDTVLQPSFEFRKEGIWGLEASVGTTPLEGEVHPTLTGHFDVVHHKDGARYSAGFHRNSIYESLLSITGMNDTVTGEPWGRVVESGVHAQAYQPLTDTIALTGEARWGERKGADVDSNQTRFFSLGAVYSFEPEGFSYVAVGPSFRLMEFDKNRSFFTRGHGGYYSPAESQNISVNLSFMTAEERDWIGRGSLSLGYEEAESDAAPFYPLDVQPGDPFYAASQSDGMSFSFEGVAARRLNDVVIGELGAYGIETEDYSEAGVFLKLRVSFGKRTKTWRSDLTEEMHRRYH